MADKAKSTLKPHFEDVQAHYDLSDEFFAQFLDASRTYSCAYFEPEDIGPATPPTQPATPPTQPATPPAQPAT